MPLADTLDAITRINNWTQTTAKDADSLASEVVSMREFLTLSIYPIIVKDLLTKPLSFLAYACEHPARRKRISMDVEKMVDVWIPLIKKLAVAHDVDEKDMASSMLDEHLLPVVGAPVAQIREFYRLLTKKLKEDATVPWAVWKLFDFWGENVLDKITSEEELKLKTDLATKIAKRSMELIPPEDWLLSMVGALQWRHPDKLAEIDKKLDQGEQPRVKGKESCLFLRVGESEVML